MPESDLVWLELSSRLKERFGSPVRSKFFRFLHRLMKGNIVPMATTSTPNAIKSHKDQPLEEEAGGEVRLEPGW